MALRSGGLQAEPSVQMRPETKEESDHVGSAAARVPSSKIKSEPGIPNGEENLGFVEVDSERGAGGPGGCWGVYLGGGRGREACLLEWGARGQ